MSDLSTLVRQKDLDIPVKVGGPRISPCDPGLRPSYNAPFQHAIPEETRSQRLAGDSLEEQ